MKVKTESAANGRRLGEVGCFPRQQICCLGGIWDADVRGERCEETRRAESYVNCATPH